MGRGENKPRGGVGMGWGGNGPASTIQWPLHGFLLSCLGMFEVFGSSFNVFIVF